MELFQIVKWQGQLHVVDRWTDYTWCGLYLPGDTDVSNTFDARCYRCGEVRDRLERVIA